MKQEVRAAIGVAAVGIFLATARFRWWLPLVAYLVLVCYIAVKAILRVISRRVENLVRRIIEDTLAKEADK